MSGREKGELLVAVIRRCLKETCSINEKGKFDKDSDSCMGCAYNIEVTEERKPLKRIVLLAIILGIVMVGGIIVALCFNGTNKSTSANAEVPISKPSETKATENNTSGQQEASSKAAQENKPQEDPGSQTIKVDTSRFTTDSAWQNNDLKEKYLNIINEAEGRLMLDFRFDRGASVLDEKALKDIELLVEFLKSSKYSEHKIILIGFADNLGNYGENLSLSKSRASEVRKHLIERESSLESRVSADGFGKEQPAASNDTAEGKYKNRRVEVWLVKK